MVLSNEEILERIENPANEYYLQQGRKQEARHKLHVNGDMKELHKFLRRVDLLETEDTFQLRVRSTTAYTKPIYAQIKNILFRGLSHVGNIVKFSFSNPRLEEDYREYLEDHWHDGFFTNIHEQYKQISLTGFQGLFLVDVENEEGVITPYPTPVFKYISSHDIHDVSIKSNEVEYVILKTEFEVLDVYNVARKVQRYITIDGERIVWHDRDRNKYTMSNEIFHEIGYCPACVVTQVTERDDTDVQRASLISASLEHADILLTDHSEHQLNKKLHAFQEKWSYAQECPACEGKQVQTISTEDGEHTITCRTCSGTGGIIPTGPSKVYMVNPPQRKDDAAIALPPAGYVVKDLSPTQYLFEQMTREEGNIPKSVFSKDGIVSFDPTNTTATGKQIDLDQVHNKISEFTENAEFVIKFILETMGRYRYGQAFNSAHVAYSKNYSLRSAAQLESIYAEKKKSGIEENMLLASLKEILEAKYRDDTDELLRQQVKLDLTPFPTYTLAEIQSLSFVTEDQKRMKVNINDYFLRFETENGSVVEFASLLPYSRKIALIREIFQSYNTQNNGKTEEDNSRSTSTGGNSSAGGERATGDRPDAEERVSAGGGEAADSGGQI